MRPQPSARKPTYPAWAVVLAVGAALLLVVGGVCASIAVPAARKYQQRKNIAEAESNLEMITRAFANAYERANTVEGEELADRFGRMELHKEQAERGYLCPIGDRVESGVTPPLDVNCNAGEHGCAPSAYGTETWTKNAVWKALDVGAPGLHHYHYSIEWEKRGPECRFTIRAFGDLDDDGVFSTFERSGVATREDGVGVGPLVVDNRNE